MRRKTAGVLRPLKMTVIGHGLPLPLFYQMFCTGVWGNSIAASGKKSKDSSEICCGTAPFLQLRAELEQSKAGRRAWEYRSHEDGSGKRKAWENVSVSFLSLTWDRTLLTSNTRCPRFQRSQW